MKKANLVALICSVLCAAIWITRVILDVVYQKSGALLALNLLCVVLWIAVSVKNLKRCRLDKEER